MQAVGRINSKPHITHSIQYLYIASYLDLQKFFMKTYHFEPVVKLCVFLIQKRHFIIIIIAKLYKEYTGKCNSVCN